MTSYANDTSTTAAATPTNTNTTAAPAEITTTNSSASTPAATIAAGGANITSLSPSPATVNRKYNKQMSNQQSPSRYDDDDSSDGREKIDTTPENIKKIADIIGDKAIVMPNSPHAAPASRLAHANNTHHNASLVGLGAAIDESNVKFCLGKPPPLPAEKALSAPSPGHSSSNNSDHNVEHSEKSSNSNSNNKDDRGQDEDESIGSSTTTTTKQSLAFTIDNFDTKDTADAATQAARYKSMMERFQNRHKRGASMSKLESEGGTSSTGRHSQRSSIDASSSIADDGSVAATPTEVRQSSTTTSSAQVKLRDRSASRVRDASKRHSWSPRSSSSAANNVTDSTPTPTAAPRRSAKTKLLPPPATAKGAANTLANRTQFTPRSTAMQLALQQVDLICPPLADVKRHNDEMEADAVSDAGTYTLDGDNYTEEQKDLMNIDRNAAKAAKQRPKQLAVKSSSAALTNRGSNVLEVNYYHETPLQEQKSQPGTKANKLDDELMLGSHPSAGAYFEQVKSRVLRNMCPKDQQQALQPPHTPDADVGCFTSVTTSGVLAKQRALDTHPKLIRHTHSLSTSQIDSSEYVTNEAKIRHAQALAGTATDHQKAEYRLNVFTTSTHQRTPQESKYAATRQLLATPPETPTTPTAPSLHGKELSDTALLQTAQTKQDWIQEWARNARARSLAQDVSSSRRKQQAAQNELMTRSYNCSDTGADSLTDDSLYNQQRQYANKLNRTLAERYRLLGDCDYASDPALCSHGVGPNNDQQPPYKPPKSPSKIPSPLHTLGRARSASRSRAAIPPDAYLEQTAAAISNLQQSLSRKSSIKSPAHSGSHCSPQHSLEAGVGYRRSPLHRSKGGRSARDSLMTSSINEAQLQLLTSGDYLLKQMRQRKNSLDDVEVMESPVSPLKQTSREPASASASLSPLRRSSSFSAAKILGQHQQQHQHHQQPPRQARPNFQNLYTPPAARHQQQYSTQLKKSASSNNFDQAYSDYDNELQYYINDEDEMGTTGAYYSSGEEEENEAAATTEAVPLSNTRLNKALLMRIERSKQRVAGVAPNMSHSQVKPSSAPAGKLSAAQAAAQAAGLVACPNTPELPRRGIKSAPRATTTGVGVKNRQSMPREASLSRLAQQVPSSLASAKKQLLQTANQRVQPKYMDISKYKSAQSNNFLRKNDAKSTLKPTEQMKRSPSASSMGLTRGDATRASNRSVRSAASVMNSSTNSLGGSTANRASSAVRRDASVNKQKEAEMAMWKRRSTYDPMKAAAEDRRKKEEARRAQAQRQLADMSDMPFESAPQRPANNLTITGSINYSPRNSVEHDAWTLGESSEYGDYDEEEADHYVGQESDDVFEVESAEASDQVAD
ncbi:uncharacterized protein LOC115622121 isoform X2 [Scaptodrosophila lebanonensis]|uniref:Uncharacterized protein LOC115622121 isoform X2 n=1 Tax=Drosophila lebanonensis TaxID=7225 RepID=A0A6J2T4H8_DROLE|nr:uncharacterized protein LOC115622121 isoform X2 [Scaptodrosophila lebanonensis]